MINQSKHRMDLRTARKVLGLTQQQIADQAGVSITTIRDWEGGTGLDMTFRRSKKAAAAYGCNSIDELFEIAENTWMLAELGKASRESFLASRSN